MNPGRRRYIICAPLYSGSGGVRALYELCRRLRERGHQAQMFVYGRRFAKPKRFFAQSLSRVTDDMREHDIVVYPEMVWGNPLAFRHVVRWILNKPGLLGGNHLHSSDELVVTWSRQYKDVPDVLSVDLVDKSLFFDAGDKRSTDAVFVHKGGVVRDVPELRGLPLITMSYPETREELASLLRRTRVLYSHDKHSTLLEEAAAAGARIKVITESGMEDLSFPEGYADREVFDRQLDKFIEKTQTMACPERVNREGVPLPGTKVFYWVGFALFSLLRKSRCPGNWDRPWAYCMQKAYLR